VIDQKVLKVVSDTLFYMEFIFKIWLIH